MPIGCAEMWSSDKDLGKEEIGDSSTQNWGPPQLWNETESWKVPVFKEAHQGEVRKETSDREEPRAGITKAKGGKKHQ